MYLSSIRPFSVNQNKVYSKPNQENKAKPSFGKAFVPCFVKSNPNLELENFTEKLLKRFSSVYGDNFEKAFWRPLNKYLDKNELKIDTIAYPNSILQINTKGDTFNMVELFQSNFLDKTGKPLTKEDSLATVTPNSSRVLLLTGLAFEKFDMPVLNNPLVREKLPYSFELNIADLHEGMFNLHKKWLSLPDFDSPADKIEQLKRSTLTLMPE